MRRLELCGNFGNSGVNIFAEALKTNTSLRTISFGCHKALTDVGGQVLLNVVDPFSHPSTDAAGEWEHIKKSNNTLQSIYILDRPTATVEKALISKLQTITSLDAHSTLQRKCWHHIEKNIDNISHMGLDSKHMPEVLAFVHQHGTMDHLFRIVKSRATPELFNNPSPERARLSRQMDRIERENRVLKEQLEVERERWKCCLLPVSKLRELWRMIVELFNDI